MLGALLGLAAGAIGKALGGGGNKGGGGAVTQPQPAQQVQTPVPPMTPVSSPSLMASKMADQTRVQNKYGFGR